MTSKFDRWPWETTRNLFNTTSNFLHHFKAIGDFKLELQSGNSQFVLNRRFLSRMTLNFEGWPWKTIQHLLYTTGSFVHHFIAICEFKMELKSGNAQFGSKSAIFCTVWRHNFTDDLANSMTPILCYFKFVHYFIAICELKMELQSRNTLFGSKSMISFILCDLQISQITMKNNRHLCYVTSSFVQHFIAIGEFKWELQSGNTQFGSKSM